MPSFTAELVERASLSPSVVGLTFLANRPFLRKAGQYVVLSLQSGGQYAFSVASPFEPSSPERFEIAAARGTTAEALLELPLGSVVGASGPGGALVWQAAAPSLFIATGTGISPLRALIWEELRRGAPSPLLLLFGCRDAQEELWGRELQDLASTHSRFQFWPTHSRPLPSHPGRSGRVQVHVSEAVQQLGSSELRAYVCGHIPMVADCQRLLRASGVTPERIHAESY
jgi:CDP-4-dehydro-6-deoxyglucose reductase